MTAYECVDNSYYIVYSLIIWVCLCTYLTFRFTDNPVAAIIAWPIACLSWATVGYLIC